jgi:hypothetical protein
VENNWLGEESLFVDNELQDGNRGFALRSGLTGSIKDREGSGERIKVSLGGWFTVNCLIFINDTLIFKS